MLLVISLTQKSGVPLETMTKFNRLKQITDDISVIAEAMKKSTSGLIEVGWYNISRAKDLMKFLL